MQHTTATTPRHRHARQATNSKLLTGATSARSSSSSSAVKGDVARATTTRVLLKSDASSSARSVSSSSSLAASSTSSTRSTSDGTVVKKKVDEILKRMLPHSIVQSYDKITAALKTQVVVAVNGEFLEAVERDQGPLNAKWAAQQEAVLSSMASSSKKKPATASQHPFHYARSVQYASTQPELSLSESFKTLDVTLTSTASGASTQWSKSQSTVLTKKSWRLVAETDRKIGLALYELPLGPWGASSLVVLVWAKTLEVLNIYLQLHVAELLYNCPPRAIRILPDDVDTTYGLHSFTAAVTIRDFYSTFWEHEVFSIAFPALVGAQDTTGVDLLDEESGYRDRARFITSPVGASLATDAISISLESAIVVDFTLWGSACNPVWGFTKLLPMATREAPRTASDFSISVAGEKRQLLELRYSDASRGNTLTIMLEKPSASSSTAKKQSVFVKQITLDLGVAFINKTFSTNYAVKTQAGK